MNLTETLKLLAAEPDADLDIAEVALLIAADEYPDLDVPIYLARLDSLADELAPRLAGSLADRVTELSALLFEEHGLAGNGGEYYDPRNSYLCDVLDRKLGIPITLSVVALAVGQRAGLDVNGVALPGHFVAMASEGGGVVLFDPFNGGQLLTVGACETLVSAVVGSPFRVTPEVLRPAPPGAVALLGLGSLSAIRRRRAY